MFKRKGLLTKIRRNILKIQLKWYGSSGFTYEIIRANEHYTKNYGWLTATYHFSFMKYFNPKKNGIWCIKGNE